MKKVLYMLLFCGVTALWAGCQSSTDAPKNDSAPATDAAPASDAQSNAAEPVSSEFTWVELKVPNMT